MRHTRPGAGNAEPAHTRPSRSSMRLVSCAPGGISYSASAPSFQLRIPELLLIQSAPLRAASNEYTEKLAVFVRPDGGCHGTGLTPSNRNNPLIVPTHRKPSGVWVMAVTAPLGKPSRAFHVVRAY